MRDALDSELALLQPLACHVVIYKTIVRFAPISRSEPLAPTHLQTPISSFFSLLSFQSSQ